MRVYFYLEDEKSSRRILPSWLKILAPSYKNVFDISQLEGNSYVVASGCGYPQMTGANLKNTLSLISMHNNVDLFVVLLDSEGFADRKKVFCEILQKSATKLQCAAKVLVVEICFETWLLGNSDLMTHSFKKNYSDLFNHYDVSMCDPEYMRKQQFFSSSDAQYHTYYCNKLFMAKNNSRFGYNKASPPREIYSEQFVLALAKRAASGQLKSFAGFLQLTKLLQRGVVHSTN